MSKASTLFLPGKKIADPDLISSPALKTCDESCIFPVGQRHLLNLSSVIPPTSSCQADETNGTYTNICEEKSPRDSQSGKKVHHGTSSKIRCI